MKPVHSAERTPEVQISHERAIRVLVLVREACRLVTRA